MNPILSLIIPTHRRPQILRRCLEQIDRQTVRTQLEVIVVSDGPDKDVRSLVEHTPWHAQVKYFDVPKSQQGVARNRGVREATAPLCLFIGDDIFLATDACEKHLNAHAKALTPDPSPVSGERGEKKPLSSRSREKGVGDRGHSAVLGFTTWDPSCSITPVMRWLEESGWQFGYPLIARYAGKAVPPKLQHRFTYTSHISLPTAIAKAHPFREDVSLYGWEDIEWGMRLRDAGVGLFYQPFARALHHHHLELGDSLRRMETLGRSAVSMETLVPDMRIVPRGLKKLAYRISAFVPTVTGRHRKAFLRGIGIGTEIAPPIISGDPHAPATKKDILIAIDYAQKMTRKMDNKNIQKKGKK